MPQWRIRLTGRGLGWVLVAAATALAGMDARCAHPLLTEDTGTQGTRNAELQLGASWTRDRDAQLFAFQPQLSYGLATAVDVIVQGAWLDARADGQPRTRGFGDTLVDLKWRFASDGAASFALRAGLTLPTAQHGLGVTGDQPSWHALLVTTLVAAPFTVDCDAGYARNARAGDQRVDLYHASVAAEWMPDEQWTLVVNPSIDSYPTTRHATWPAVLLVGVIYAVQPGLDLDVGYQAALNQVAPSRQWTAGLTYRWGP